MASGGEATELAKLRAENEALRAENAVLRGESGEGVTLDGLAATLRDFVERTDHALHHQGVDEISEVVQALKEAEENLSPEDIAQAREMFDRYDADGSGAIDTDELAMLMLALGETIPQDRLNSMVEELDENNNGVIDFTEFLRLLAILAGEKEETSNIKKVKLGQVSYYGRSALMRWIKHDGGEINGDVTGPLIHPIRRFARRVALDKYLELFFYSAIVVAGTVSGLQTYPQFADSAVLVGIEWLTLAAFTIEITLKLCAESSGKLRFFFTDMWNVSSLLFRAAVAPRPASATHVTRGAALRRCLISSC